LYSYPQEALKLHKTIWKRRYGPKTRAWRVARKQLLRHEMDPTTFPKSRKKNLTKVKELSVKKSEPLKKDVFAELLKRLIKI
jgi:hypothetical protein